MRETRLNQLDPRIMVKVLTMLRTFTEAGIKYTVINTLRTAEEHAEDLKNKVSWIPRSLHQPQPPSGLSLAIDVAPTHVLELKNWAPTDPMWQQMGKIGKECGLAWGGDWFTHPDLSHFEYKK